MFRSVSFFLFVALVGGCTCVPDIKQEMKRVKTYSATDFFKTVGYFGASFSLMSLKSF